jgi:acyl-CoA thioester hydrolase
MIPKSFFKRNTGDPPPLRDTIKRTVRFDELDPLNIMWHGNYASYFEEGRIAIGSSYGFGYADFAANNVIIPLKKFYAEYILPMEFAKTYTVETLLYWNEAARLDFEYRIYDEKNNLVTMGYSVHMMVDSKKGILVAKPGFFEEICAKWKEGKI